MDDKRTQRKKKRKLYLSYLRSDQKRSHASNVRLVNFGAFLNQKFDNTPMIILKQHICYHNSTKVKKSKFLLQKPSKEDSCCLRALDWRWRSFSQSKTWPNSSDHSCRYASSLKIELFFKLPKRVPLPQWLTKVGGLFRRPSSNAHLVKRLHFQERSSLSRHFLL